MGEINCNIKESQSGMRDMPMLKGLFVVDVSQLGPGPFSTRLLADLGAEVIKVEPPHGDPTREIIPGSYEALNRNKKSIVLNLKMDEGRQILFKLIEKADVFVESNRPGVARRLGIDYDQVKSVNKKIVYCSISGYGQDGPYSAWSGHDINYCAVAGISSVSGHPSGPPDIGSGLMIADYCAGLYACLSILSMLYTHKGGFLDVAIADSALSLMAARVNEYIARGKPEKKRFLGRGGYGIFRTKDGKYLSISAIEEYFWQRLCRALGHEDLAKDTRLDSWLKRNEHMDEINGVLSEAFLTRSRDEWISLLSKVDIPCSPVNFIDDLPHDPHIKHRGLMLEREQNGRRILNILFPVRFDGELLPLRSPAPSYPGQDTDQILVDLGLNEAEIRLLREKGVVG